MVFMIGQQIVIFPKAILKRSDGKEKLSRKIAVKPC